MATADDLTLLRAIMVQAWKDELAAFDLAAKTPTVVGLTAVKDRIGRDDTAIEGQLVHIIAGLPTTGATARIVDTGDTRTLGANGSADTRTAT